MQSGEVKIFLLHLKTERVYIRFEINMLLDHS